jgi:hypothetical protein
MCQEDGIYSKQPHPLLTINTSVHTFTTPDICTFDLLLPTIYFNHLLDHYHVKEMQIQKEAIYINGFHFIADLLKYTKCNTRKRSTKTLSIKYNDRNM